MGDDDHQATDHVSVTDEEDDDQVCYGPTDDSVDEDDFVDEDAHSGTQTEEDELLDNPTDENDDTGRHETLRRLSNFLQEDKTYYLLEILSLMDCSRLEQLLLNHLNLENTSEHLRKMTKHSVLEIYE